MSTEGTLPGQNCILKGTDLAALKRYNGRQLRQRNKNEKYNNKKNIIARVKYRVDKSHLFKLKRPKKKNTARHTLETILSGLDMLLRYPLYIRCPHKFRRDIVKSAMQKSGYYIAYEKDIKHTKFSASASWKCRGCNAVVL